MTDDIQERREAFAEQFGRDLDPLKEFEADMEAVPFDPFELYWDAVVDPKDLAPRSQEKYRGVYAEWKTYMRRKHDRHPACPSEGHVAAYIDWQTGEQGNSGRTTTRKIYALSRAYQYWQDEDGLPHAIDSNPFNSALKKAGLSDEDPKKPPWIPRPELRERLADVDHIRDHAFIFSGLKLGLRAGEISNIMLEDIALPNDDARNHYPQMGSSAPIQDHTSALYVPHDREGNKSKRPRVLPLDYELRSVLTRYLLIRPDVDEPWLFLGKDEYTKTTNQAVNGAWLDHFRPEYDETARNRAVTSHYGRHYFTTWFEKHVQLDPRLVDYMRGDKIGGKDLEDRTASQYTHVYYDDIEQAYLDNIYRLRP